jgi:hypothetical protein
MSSANQPISPAADFEETRAAHLAQFSKTSPDERIEWLGQMLEIMQLADESRIKRSQNDSKPAPSRSASNTPKSL